MNLYYVVESEQVVAEDLAEAIRLSDPSSLVKTFRAEEGVLSALHVARPKAMILSRDPLGFPDTPLGRMLAESGIPYAFLSTLGDEPAQGAVVLTSPFSDEAVSAFLHSLPE